jgi:carbon-monoxide dehydrogenase medium subunit
VALLALDAEAQITNAQGQTWQPVGDLFLGPGKSAIDPSREMITAFRFPLSEGPHGSAWERIGRRRALVLPILNCGVRVGLNDDGQQFDWARIALGPVAPVPFRAREAEAFLAGRPVTKETITQAAEIASREAKPRTSLLRASKEYRVKVLKVLVRQGLTRAAEQAQARLAEHSEGQIVAGA